jgi:hypothetical protein
MTPTPNRLPQRTIPSAPTRRELRSHPTVRNYTLFCLAALFLLVVCLADRGLDWWSLLPALVGSMALLAQWSIGPPLVLLSLTGLILSSMRSSYMWRSPYWARDKVPTMMDLILCVAVLAYVVGHYRLLALMRHVFPPDPRRLPGSGFADPARRRSADLVSVREMVVLLLALPLWTSLSVVVWSWMMDDAAPLYMTKEVWQALRLVWAGLAIVAATGAVAGYLRQTLATPEEGLLHLQDQLWQHTRREQGNLHRWLARARLRARRGRERS